MKRWRKLCQLRPKRIEWLIANEDLWGDSQHNFFSSDAVRRDGWRLLVERMKEANLVTQSTYWADVNIPVLIKDARNKIERDKERDQERANSSVQNSTDVFSSPSIASRKPAFALTLP